MANRIPLSEVLQNIAEELIQAQENATRRDVAVMEFAECEMEFAVKAEYEGGGKIKIYVAELGGEAKKSESNTVKIKFRAIPGKPVQAKGTSTGAAPQIERKSQDVER